MEAEHVSFAPGRLAPYVAGMAGYRVSGCAPGVHVGLPSSALTLVVPIGEPLVMSAAGAGPTAYDGVVGGLHDRPVTIHHDGHQLGVHVDLTPAGARALLGFRAADLAGTLALDDVLPTADRRLTERVADAASWPARFDVVLAALTRRLRAGAADAAARPEVSHAWAEIRRTHGQVPVWAVASAVGWSTRHLGEQFRGEYGVTPKTAARLARFARSRDLVATGTPLAETAAVCGYADQAHLNREWRALAGTSPTRWARDDELAFVQDRT